MRDAMTLENGHTVRGDGVGKPIGAPRPGSVNDTREGRADGEYTGGDAWLGAPKRIKGKLPADSGGQPLPLDRMANGKSPARVYAQDLMRGEHVVGTLSGVQHGSTPPHGPSVTQAPDGTLEYRPSSGTSIFDPVLCELAYRWFTPPAAHILDPFAGGSVRGIVAAKLGRRYTGIDLRAEQIAGSREWIATR